VVFAITALALVPIARFIGRATSDLALRANPTVAGLLAATFGNMIELVIAGLALQKGLVEVVKASIVGSIVGNILLLIGLSMFAGGLRYRDQTFNRESAGVSSTMLIIAVTGLSVPTVFLKTSPQVGERDLPVLSAIVCAVLAATYVCGLVFTFKTHRQLFDVTDEMREAREQPAWSARKAGVVLALATLAAAVESEALVAVIEPAGKALGLGQLFIGVVIIAVVTNVAENTTAILYALRDNVNLAIEIGTSSAIQIALFVVPILVGVGAVVGTPFTLDFTLLEVAAMMFAVMIVNYLSADGRCNWLEGVQLLAVYTVLAAGFFLAG
jgi:Ca2+:H+ antiporter